MSGNQIHESTSFTRDHKTLKFRLSIRSGGPIKRSKIFSDGVVDARNEQDEAFGLERLKLAFMAAGNQKNGAVLPLLTQAIDRWRGKAPAFDDVTMLLVEAVP